MYEYEKRMRIEEVFLEETEYGPRAVIIVRHPDITWIGDPPQRVFKIILPMEELEDAP